MKRIICSYCQRDVPKQLFCSQCGGPLLSTQTDLTGEVVSVYGLEELLAKGATGRVYRAHHIATKQTVALKLLLPELAADPRSIRRFRREAEAGLRLRHPHAVKLFEFGIASEYGIFLVMEYVQGIDLRQLLRKEGPLPPPRAIHLALQTLEALEAAHDLAIVHRDLKPANLMLQEHPSGRDFLKICDFGSAHVELAAGEFDTVLTVSGNLTGTPGYMSPEQLQGQMTPDGRADLYALGIILYEMLTGQMPFLGESPAERVMSTLWHEPRPLLVALPSLASYPAVYKLASIILRCLHRDPQERFRDAAAVRIALLACLPSPSEPNLQALQTEPSLPSFATDAAEATEPLKTLAPPPPSTLPSFQENTVFDTRSVVETGTSAYFYQGDSETLVASPWASVEVFHPPLPTAPPHAAPWALLHLTPFDLQFCHNFAQKAPEQMFLPQQRLLAEEGEPSCFYFIQSGEVRLWYAEEERILEVDRLGADSFLGVSSFFSKTAFFLHAETARLSLLHRIDAATFLQWLREHPASEALFRGLYYEALFQDILRYSAFFASIPVEQRPDLLRDFTIVPVGKGKDLRDVTSVDSSFCLVASGQIEITLPPYLASSRPRLRILRTGQFFGEDLLLSSASVVGLRSLSDAILLSLPIHRFSSLFAPYPHIFELLHRTYASRYPSSSPSSSAYHPRPEPFLFL